MAPQESLQRARRSTISLREKKDVARLAKDLEEMVLEKRKPRKAGGQRVNTSMAPFQGVSTVASAPVTIGNTLRSVLPKVTVANGVVRVTGRDFIMPIVGTGSGVTGWGFVGGMPLTPAALVASAIRGYFQSYQSYRWLRLDAHYISSSPTSLAGDILLMWHANRGGPKVNHNSANFMSYALSTANALLGPQWSNHTVSIMPSQEWRNTDILDAEDLQHQSDGEILVYSRNTVNGTTPDSPGYLILDYIVEFKLMMTNPRVLTLPNNLFKWANVGIRCIAGGGSFSPAQGDRVLFTTLSADNYTANNSVLTGNTVGFIYQMVLDLDVSLYNPNGINLSTCWGVKYDDQGATSNAPYALTTGTTLYLGYNNSAAFEVYPNYDAALTGRPLVWASAFVNINLGLNVMLSLCGSITPALQQANIG